MKRMLNLQTTVVERLLALVATSALIFASAPTTTAQSHFRGFRPISMENPAASGSREKHDPSGNIPVVKAEKNGGIATNDGRLLRVNADPGDIEIFTDETSRISYDVRVEADSREPGATEFVHQMTVTARATSSGVVLDGRLPWREFHGRFRMGYEIHIPRHYSVEVRTSGGNIDLRDIDGKVDLYTEGGAIVAGEVSGGSSSAGAMHSARPAAKLETLGGQISIGNVGGTLRATTAGGHITAGDVSGDAILRTRGGQIRTGRISGTADLGTGGGNITAWLADTANAIGHHSNAGGKSGAASQLFSSEGDIIVYVPQRKSATIDAIIDRNGGHRIIADASLPLQIGDDASESDPRTIRFMGRLNGGGELLHLRAASGNVLLKFAGPRSDISLASPATWVGSGASSRMETSSYSRGDSNDLDALGDQAGLFAEFRRRILESWWGGVPIDAAEMQKHLERSVAPAYPDVARQAGIEGDVALRVLLSPDGRVASIKVLDGPPILARAAVEAVEQWQYQALRMNDEPVTVVTTLIISFRLR
jgi:TonB family protein